MTVVQAARAAGLKSENALANFLAGQTYSLSLETAEPLARSLRVSLNELVGIARVTIRGQFIFMKGSIASGRWNGQLLWPRNEWREYLVPRDPKYGGKSYVLLLETTEMNEVWPANTPLEVVNLADFKEELREGHRVILVRTNPEGFYEIGAREIQMCADSKICNLVARSTDPQFQGRSIPITWPAVANRVETAPNGDRFQVLAVIIRSYRDETPPE